jgi:ATPase subunit of ABC transporter with duplicated ATPase domains
MRKIAILQDCWNYDSYSNAERIIEKITDFVEVSDEDYNLLVNASHQQGFTVIQMPSNTQEFVENTVQAYLESIKAKEEKRRKAEQERKRLREENKRRQKEKEEEAERKKLEELIRKHGIPKLDIAS